MRVYGSSYPGSGTQAEDFRRESQGQAAALLLFAGRSGNCLSGDHLSGTDLCVDVLVRNANNSAKALFFNDGLAASKALQPAGHRLREGVGVNVNQGNHSGGNTCAQVIAALADNF